MKRAALAVLLIASHASAGSRGKLAGHVAAVALNFAATYLDMRSSLDASRRGLYETNSLFRSKDGGFHARGVVGIWAITGVVSGAELALWHQDSRWQTGAQSFSGTLAAQHFRAAHHNWKLIGH